ncbi:serine/threonine-protein kinase [Streptomyces sp. NPDC058572]|uniref:serine/threonine-protein kinase n=1 Tax=Streptomyces sp. NPDC058572 TaxID=3346546 RepID=UPI0036529A5B
MDALTPEDPSRIGPFRLIGRLGSGGMGRVYLARSEGGRTVAVKLVHAQLAEQDEFRRRFAREVASLERVGGAGTAPVIASDTSADAPWVAITYVPGPSLRTVVGEEFGPLPPVTVQALAHRLADALAHIHSAGLVHRDLKPSNILLTVDGPRIIDFGIARAVDTVTDGGLTGTGAVVGSPGFMSPEQVRGERVTPASDVFCLGAVLAYAATGTAPFGSADSGAHAMMFRIAHDEPDLTGLPPELVPLVRACLDKDPQRRPSASVLAATDPGAGDTWLPAGVLAGLGRSAAQLLDADTPVPGRDDATPADEPGAPAPRRRRRTAVVASAVATAVLAAGGVAAAVFWPQGAKRDDGSNNAARTPSHSGGSTTQSKAGEVPEVFLGAWEGVLDGTAQAPYATGRIEITQGKAGEKAAVYVMVTGERLCMGRSVLVSADSDRIVFGESDVTVSVPEKQCTPAAHQTLTVRSPDVLEWRSGTVTSTFRKSKSGPDIVPATFVGVWQEDESGPEWGPGQADLFDRRVTITQGPVGAPLVRFDNTNPRTDEETGEPTGGSFHCAGTAVLAGVGTYLVAGPSTLDEAASDSECVESPASQYLRVDRFEGKERLLVYGMSADGEPGEYYRQ